MQVIKFGGSILTEQQDFAALLSIVQQQLEPTLVVVSALSHTTRLLEKAMHLALNNNEEGATDVIKTMLQEHRTIASTIINKQETIQNIDTLLSQVETDVQKYLRGISITGELTPRTRDIILSYGEYIALHIITQYVTEHGIQAGCVESNQYLITNSTHGHATPLRDKTIPRVERILRPAFEQTPIILTQGFVARSEDGLVTTMGKESSNLTATLLAELLQAKQVTIYTNVEGIRSADPQLQSTTKAVPSLTYSLAYKAAVNGVKLLYPTMIEPLRRSGIPMVIKSLHNPNGNSTTISKRSASEPIPIITVVDDVSVLRLSFQTAEARAQAPEIISTIFPDTTQIITTTEYPDALTVVAYETGISHISSVIPDECTAFTLRGYSLIRLFNSSMPSIKHLNNELVHLIQSTESIIVDAGYNEGTFSIITPNNQVQNVVTALHDNI
ncbi:MAG: hypothetical protein JNJ85_13165 [Candidatus Kapabacteria bacterium]|nr:hypothetical protein [Candidatus Kapabacteria bacterium]MBX7153756.1 hypothetical protein [Bacteroidota bacterium]